MVQQGKSFRHGHTTAPYREPIKSQRSSKSSFFNKIKTFLDRKTSVNTKSNEKKRVSSTIEHFNSNISAIPGGFFSPGNLSTSLNMPKQRKVEQRSTSNLSIGDKFNSIADQSDESHATDTSNARLADFFRVKGNEPLSDIEMEGVISLMRRTNTRENSRRSSVANSVINAHDYNEIAETRILKSSKTPSIASSSFKAPAFIPKFDTSIGSNVTANPSIRSTSSRRRIFDYGNIPSPYRTTVYKYSAADHKNTNRTGTESVALSISSKGPVQDRTSSSINGERKKMSNTASALVSLLDNASVDAGQSASKLANPYSSHVRTYKKVLIPHNPSTASQELVPVVNDMDKKIYNSDILPKPMQKPHEKYKPLRSSSLRSGTDIHEISPEEEQYEKSEEIKTSMPTSEYTFKFAASENGKEIANKKDSSNSTYISSKNTDRETSSAVASFNVSDSSNTQPSERSLEAHKDDTNLEQRKGKSRINNSQGFTSGPVQTSASSSSPFSRREITEMFKFDLGSPIFSNVNTDEIDEEMVKKYKSIFIF